MPTSPFAGASSRGYCTVLSARSIENRAWQARLLLTYPPRVAKHWTDADIDPAAEAEIAALVERLYDLRADIGDDGDERPVLVRLTADAKVAWRAYYDAHAREQADLSGDLSAAWSKLEEYPARLAWWSTVPAGRPSIRS